MNFEVLKITKKDKATIITIERPQALNALNKQVLHELTMALQGFANDHESWGLIITGSGEKAFVAGADIKGMEDIKSAAEAVEFSRLGQSLFRQLEESRKPVVAAVNGFALGGGLELALACDFVYASNNAKLGLPEVSLGLIPGYGGCVRLAKRVGMAKAKELIFTGDFVSAEEAFRLGLVQKIFATQQELLEGALQTLKTIATRSPLAVGLAKKTISYAGDVEYEMAAQMERNCFGQLFASADQKEGVRAFIEKRKPVFQGK